MAFYAHPINHDYTVSPTDDGTILILGNTSLTDSSGAVRVTFYPSSDFIGQFNVMARPSGAIAYDREQAFYQTPYREIYVNGQPSDYRLNTVSLAGGWDIQVPANASSIGLMVACTRGTGRLYWQPITRGADVAAVPSGAPVGANSIGPVMDQFIRPANTTAYTAGDAVNNTTTAAGVRLLAFPGLCTPGRSATIYKALLETDLNTFTSAMTAHLYAAQAPSASVVADNAAATTLLVNSPLRLGQIPFPALAGGAGTNTALIAWSAPALTVVPQTSDAAVYALLVDNTGSTPASGQLFRMSIWTVPN